MKVSILSIITNQRQAVESRESVEHQTIFRELELFQIENGNQQFSSAAKAYNWYANQVSGEVLIFMHQDVYLWDPAAVEKIYEFIMEHPNAIVGVAGVSPEDKKIYGNLFETKEKLRRTIPCTKPYMSAITLDECLFAMSADRFRSIQFDEVTTANWHFYGADICYQNILNGGENYIIPLEICHESKGNMESRSYRTATSKMISKYHGKIDWLDTTCISIRCSHVAHVGFYLKRAIYPFVPKRVLGIFHSWKEKRIS